ncbi:MAG: TolC family protein, partial [Terriglobales bacterium]
MYARGHTSMCILFVILAVACSVRCAFAGDMWLSDPFSSQQKADRLVTPTLRPPSCPGAPNLKHKLHMNDVVITSLCNNPDTKAAYLTLLGQASTYVSNYSAYLPTVTATASDSRGTTFSKGSAVGGLGTSYGISAGMTLYDFGQREFKLEGAEQALIAAGYSYDSTLQGAIAMTLKAYFQLLTAQNNIEVAREVEQYDKSSYEAALLRHNIGMAPLSDVLQAKGAYAQAELSSEQADNTLAQDQAALALLMGLPADAPVGVAELDD